MSFWYDWRMTKTQRHMVIPRTMSLVFCGDKLLMIKSSSKKDWEGVYGPVGGHIEQGEDVLESSGREIVEESGIKVETIRLAGVVHASNFYGKEIMLFVTVSETQDEELEAECDEGEIEWVDIDDLEKMRIHEDVLPIVRWVIDNPEGLFTARSRFDDGGKLVELKLKGI